jgi:hypothetical protein
MSGPTHREADEYEQLAREQDQVPLPTLPPDVTPGFDLMRSATPRLMESTIKMLEMLAGGRVSACLLLTRYDDAIAGNTRAVVWSNECVHNRRIMLDGALQITVLEMAADAGGPRT